MSRIVCASVLLALLLWSRHSSTAISLNRPTARSKNWDVLGAKTLHWQYENARDQIRPDHNYSEVSLQNLQAPPPKVTEADDYTGPFTTLPYGTVSVSSSTLRIVTFEQVARAQKKRQQDQQLSIDGTRVAKLLHLSKPIYVHGFKYPPDSDGEEKGEQAYAECPDSATGQFAYAYSCNRFLNCWKGHGFVSNCAPGTLFNAETRECDYASKVKCALRPGNISPQETAIKSEIKCPPNFGGNFPHHEDCSKFIECWAGVGTVSQCPADTLFSLKTNACDKKQYAECPSWSTSFGQGGSSLSLAVSPEVASYNTNDFGASADGGDVSCPPGASGLYSHPYVCSKFLNCDRGRTFVQNCGPGTVFNPALKVCDFSYNVDCTQNRGNYGENIIDVRMAPDSAEQKPTTRSSSSYESVKVACPPEASGLYPHPYVCSMFLSCDRGRTSVQNCGPGTVFNDALKVCDFDYNVDCTKIGSNHGRNFLEEEPSTRSSPSYESVKVACPPGASGLYSHPYICSKFLNCDKGRTFVQDCGPGTVFNSALKVCDFPYNVDCAPSNFGENVIDIRMSPDSYETENGGGVSCPLGVSGLLPHPRFYSKFIVCDKGRALTMDCALGSAFDSATKACDIPYDVDITSTVSSRGHEHVFDPNRISRTASPPDRRDTTQSQPSIDEMLEDIYGKSPSLHKDAASEDTEEEPNDTTTLLTTSWTEADESALESGGGGAALSASANRSPCDSFHFLCHVDECVPSGMVCDGIADCSNGLDEKDCQRYLDEFELIADSVLAVREKDKLLNNSASNCAKMCVESKGAMCRSFSYRKVDGTCFMSDSNVGRSGALIASKPYDYYELKRESVDCGSLHVCPNKKCIESRQMCDGVDDCGDRSDEKGCSAEALRYRIGLAGAESKHEGRLEVEVFGKKGFVCDDRFGLRNADVACRELGFPLGALQVKGNSHYAQDVEEKDILYVMDDVTCLGNETSLRDCDFNGWGVNNCEPQEVVGVVCKTPLEKCPDEHWKCASVQECVPLAFLCDGVFDCSDDSDEEDARCDAPAEYRLAGGRDASEGRVEVKHYGIWGTVCDDDFNDDAAKVACAKMGFYGRAAVRKEGAFGPGKGPIWLDQVFCQGNETSLEECVHWNWGEHNCDHGEDVGVVCGGSALQVSPEAVIQRHQQPASLPDVLPQSLFPARCGYRKDDQFVEEDEVHFRVIKGSVARRGDYPWQASLRIKNKVKPAHWCGAVVISSKFVLTAAHCLVGFSKGAYFVVAGDYNTDEAEGTEQEAYIDEFYIHEHFRSGQKMNNDIALVKLKGAGFVLTKDVQPICLPEADERVSRDLNCTISGFGSVQSGISGYSHDLRAGWLRMQPDSVCKMPHVYGSSITDGMFCAGSLDEGVDACDGDSGGPLACLQNGLFTLYGITSWGQHCGHANKPGVYVKISHYRTWIDDTIERHRGAA